MDEKHLLASVRYLELNPVVAGLCKSPWDWQFSSARAHLEGQNDKLVKVSPMLERISDWRSIDTQAAGAKTKARVIKLTVPGIPSIRSARPLVGNFLQTSPPWLKSS